MLTRVAEATLVLLCELNFCNLTTVAMTLIELLGWVSLMNDDNSNQKNYQYVFSMKLAGHLMVNGFKLLRINKHLSGNNKDVYVFNKSKEIAKFIDEYIKKQRSDHGREKEKSPKEH